MENSTRLKPRHIVGVTVMALAVMGMTGAQAQQQVTSIDVKDNPWKVDVYYENDTRYRGKDKTGNTVGLSKFRNTLQAEADKKLSDGWAFHGVFRGTYDGVCQLNKDQFGKDAGSQSAADVRLENTAGPVAAAAGGLGLCPEAADFLGPRRHLSLCVTSCLIRLKASWQPSRLMQQSFKVT